VNSVSCEIREVLIQAPPTLKRRGPGSFLQPRVSSREGNKKERDHQISKQKRCNISDLVFAQEYFFTLKSRKEILRKNPSRTKNLDSNSVCNLPKKTTEVCSPFKMKSETRLTTAAGMRLNAKWMAQFKEDQECKEDKWDYVLLRT
jgi:hypothetical protein